MDVMRILGVQRSTGATSPGRHRISTTPRRGSSPSARASKTIANPQPDLSDARCCTAVAAMSRVATVIVRLRAGVVSSPFFFDAR